MPSADDVKAFIYRFRFLIAAALTIGLWQIDSHMYQMTLASGAIDNVRKEAYAALATIFGALLGFAITAFSILVSLTSTEVMKELHKDETDTEIFSGFARAISIVGLATVLSFAGIFVDTDQHKRLAFEYIVIFFAIYSALAIMGTVFLIDKIVRAVVDAQSS